MNLKQISYDYIKACQIQECFERAVNTAVKQLDPDNEIFSLSTYAQQAYTRLVEELVGNQAFEWILWWQYEAEYGTKNVGFTINNTAYNAQHTTTLKFLEIVLEADSWTS